MSQYLAKFYCGNKEGVCNFSEPMKYDKVIGRQFDNLLTDFMSQCSGDGKEKGYCCDKNDKIMDKTDMAEINLTAGEDIFIKDEKGEFFPGQIPLVRTKEKNGKLSSIDLCNCGGNLDDYSKCVAENCSDFKVPTRYEYCKIGNMNNQVGCYGENQDNCEVGNLNPKEGYVFSPKLRIKNLRPDCYLNLCNKKIIDGSLDETSNYSPETQYYAYQNDVNSKFKQSLDDYLILEKKTENPSESNINEESKNNFTSIGNILLN